MILLNDITSFIDGFVSMFVSGFMQFFNILDNITFYGFSLLDLIFTSVIILILLPIIITIPENVSNRYVYHEKMKDKAKKGVK